MRRLNHILSKKEQCSTAVFKTVTKYASYDFWGLDSMKKADSLSDDFPKVQLILFKKINGVVNTIN